MSEFSEELMLQCLEQTPPDLTALAAPLTVLHQDDPESAEAHALTIRNSLKEKNALRQIVDLFLVEADWHSADRAWRSDALEQLHGAYDDDPLYAMYLEICGLDTTKVRVKEAIRRIGVMADLVAGAFVFEAKRGFGIVKEVRHDQRRVLVDFTAGGVQDIILGFAAEKLDLINSHHLFARKHQDPEGLQQLVNEDPAEIIRITLRSFGPTPIQRIQDLLIPNILPESNWKTFWAAARKGLKSDSLVVIPTKRTEPLEILSRVKSFDSAWFRTLGDMRHMESILDSLEELLDAGEGATVVESAREKVIDRLRFVVIGAEGRHFDYSVRVWLIARQLGISSGEVNLSGFLTKAMSYDGMLRVVEALPAKMTKEFFAALAEVEREPMVEVLQRVLPQLEYSALNEAIQLLFRLGHEDKVASVLRLGWNQWESEVDVMYWLSQNRTKVEEWNYGSIPDLVARLLKVLNRDYTGNRLRVQNQLRDTFRQPVWLREVLTNMDERQRRAFTQGVKDSSAWEQLDKASVMGQIVKIDGTLQDIVSGRTEEASARGPLRVTSHRSYRDREALLEKLITKDIPENTREISVARSFGDLRENFEYKAAKDTQRLLLSRKSEFEKLLGQVHATDFSEFTTEAVGIGTSVSLRMADGSETTYHILGEWDSDASRNVISSASPLAKALTSHVPGDQVTVPGEHGEQSVQVLSVGPLAPAIRAWLDEVPPPSAEG